MPLIKKREEHISTIMIMLLGSQKNAELKKFSRKNEIDFLEKSLSALSEIAIIMGIGGLDEVTEDIFNTSPIQLVELFGQINAEHYIEEQFSYSFGRSYSA